MTAQVLPISLTASLTPRRYLSCAETAKLVRKALKEAFPDVKFSVRSSVYAGGASIDVSWTDGPLSRQVEPVIRVFAGASFDGMQDLRVSKTQAIDGARVSFGANYVFGHRRISESRTDELAAILAGIDKEVWLTVAHQMGHPSPCAAIHHAHNARDLAHALLRECGGEAYADRTSATADNVMLIDDNRD